DSIPVTLLITNDTFPSCAFDTTLYIDIHPNIAAQFYTSPLLCPETYIGFYDASYPYPVSWEWTVDGVPVSSDSMMYQYFAVGGSYTVSLAVTDSLCGADTLTDVLVLYDFPIVEIGNDTLLCPGETVTLNAGNPGMTYQWSTGQQSQIINLQVDQTTFVSVTVSNNGCERGDVIMVEMNCSLNFPNAFSPNGDGRNDFFTPHLVNMETYRMYIYNRWGELVYTMDNGLGNENEGWDGFYKNQPAPMGVYVYYATGTTIRGQSVQAQGNVALLR
ncbi:MAG TPA: gliding motility-associated C-terminal domain-containing protein, partial [Chitinophagales bacterium]|nr:gliding motility-associated C-terminal domain-containing protein [Chitinophagales bacterium]